MTKPKPPRDDDDVAPYLRKALDYARFAVAIDGGLPPNLTPAQHNEFVRLAMQIVFLCGEGHFIDTVDTHPDDEGSREALQHFRDMIATEILAVMEQLSEYNQAVRAGAAVAPSDVKSPWRM